MNPADYAVYYKAGFGDFPYVKRIYDANLNLTYVGIAPRGSATSAAVWVVRAYTLDANLNITDEKTSPKNSIMDNYLTLTYA